MEKLTSAETMELRKLRKKLSDLKAARRSARDPTRVRGIEYDIRAVELEIRLIERRPLIREINKQTERKFEMWNIARAKAAGRPLGSRWEEEWKEWLPEAAEEGWLKNYGDQVELWLLEIGQKNRAVSADSS